MAKTKRTTQSAPSLQHGHVKGTGVPVLYFAWSRGKILPVAIMPVSRALRDVIGLPSLAHVCLLLSCCFCWWRQNVKQIKLRAGACRRVRVAERFYEEMLQAGITPDVQAMNSLINAFSKAGSPDQALKVRQTVSTFRVPSPAVAHLRLEIATK